MASARRCERCRAEIPIERVMAMPETRICVRCSEEIGGEFEVSVKPENTGKEGSLKKNYGSFKIQRTRRRIRPKDGPTQ